MDANSTAPLRSEPLVTATDHRSLLTVTSWFLITATVIIVLTRYGTRWTISRNFGLDDAFIAVSLLLAICTTAAMTVGVSNGLGLLDWEAGSTNKIDKLQKAVYSFNILFILSQSFAKISVLVLIRSITPDSRHHSLAMFTGMGVVLWTVTAVFGLIFQCHVPQTWNFRENKCTNRLAFYTFVEIFNIILDSCLVLLPTFIAWHLQLKLKPKLVIISCFASRTLVIAALVVQIVVLNKENENDDAFVSWSSIIFTEVALILGIASACVPYLKPFLQSLNSGMIGTRTRGDNSAGSKYASKTKSFAKRNILNLVSSSNDDSVSRSRVGDEVFPTNLRGIPLENGPTESDRNKVFVTAVREDVPHNWENGNHLPRANFIHQTSTFAVKSEPVAGEEN